MQRGTIKWFNEDKGYGFITGDDGADVFVHIKAVDDEAALVEGAAVQYETEEGPKGIRAKAVKLVAMLLLVCVAFMAGCSGLQATATGGQYIDLSAAAAKSYVGDPNTARSLEKNAVALAALHNVATVNGFKYWFAGKELLANAAIWTTLEQEDALAAELWTRAEAGKLSDVNQVIAVNIESQWLANKVLQRAAATANKQMATRARLKALTVPRTKKAILPTPDLEALIAQLPAALKPWATEYGGQLLRLGLAEADAQIALMLAGDTFTPYCAALSTMTEEELMAEAGDALTRTVVATNTNAANVEQQRKAAIAAVSLGFSVLFALFGL